MNPKSYETGRKLHFDSFQQQPIFRHPYEKYISQIRNDSVYRISDSNHDYTVNSTGFKSREKKNIQGGFRDKNIYICQTFLKANPFFGALYRGERPRSTNDEVTPTRESDRSKSVDTDFDDSKTYRVVHSEESNSRDDISLTTKRKFKKPDNIRHFHEHHHFFHDKTREKLGSNQCGKSKEVKTNGMVGSNLSFLKQPVQESYMFYQKGGRGQGRWNRGGSKGVSRSSSKTGRKSSDNETYTVVCEHCQKILRDYPNARVVGHENVPVRLSSEVGDRRPYVQYSGNGESMRKMNWIPANVSAGDSVQGQTSRQRKSEKDNKVFKSSDESDTSSTSTSPTRNVPREKKAYKSARERGMRRRISNRNDSSFKLILFKCDHCKSIIQLPYVFKVLKSRSSSNCSSEEVLRTVMAKMSSENGRGFPKSPTAVEKVKSFGRRMSKASTIPAMRPDEASRTPTISDKRDLKKESPEGKKWSSTNNESALVDKKPSSLKEGKTSGTTSKGVITTKRSIEVSPANAGSPVSEKTKSSKKTSLSGFKLPKEFSDLNKKKSSCCGDSKIRLNRKENEEEYDPVKKIRKRPSNIRNSSKLADKKTSTSRNELDVSGKRAVGTELYIAKVEGKQKVVLMRERSMQTGSGKVVAADNSKRSSTGSKAVAAHPAHKTKRSRTAPVTSPNSRSINKESLVGGSTLSRKTVASRDVPIITIESTPEVKSGLSGIKNEISDLKTQLYRLEAMHNLQANATEIESHDELDCPKHPIVVCTSTTYIMTSYGVESNEKYTKQSPSRKASIRITGRRRDSEFGMYEESMPPRREYIGQMRVLRRENREDKQCLGGKYGDCLGRVRTPSYQVFSERMTKAVNRVCHCSNRDFQLRCGDEKKSCNTTEEFNRFFGNGQNQKRIWTGNGASTNDYLMKFAGNMENPCRWHLTDFNRGSVINAIATIGRNISNDVNERLFPLRSCSAVIGGQKFKVDKTGTSSSATEEGIIVGNVKINRGNGYFLRTSASDICEYRNGSLICLTGKPGWMVLTKKLFIRKVDKSKWKDDFPVPDVKSDWREDIFDDDDLHGSIYFPLKLQDGDAERTNEESGVSGTSVYMPWKVGDQNRGTTDLHLDVNQQNGYLPNELHLLNCKSAADWSQTCGVKSVSNVKCTCKEVKSGRRGEEANIWKKKIETVPVLFEEMKTAREAEKQPSRVSLKCVFAQTFRDKLTRSKVFWTSDWCDSTNKNKYVFAVSRTSRTEKNVEDKQQKQKWRQNLRSMVGGSRTGKHKAEGGEDGDAPVNPSSRCACCKCSSRHVCSGPNEKREEAGRFRKLMKDLGLADVNLNLLKRIQCDTLTKLKSVSHRKGNVKENTLTPNEAKSCDCAKQVEQLLNKVELLLRQPPRDSTPSKNSLPMSDYEVSDGESEVREEETEVEEEGFEEEYEYWETKEAEEEEGEEESTTDIPSISMETLSERIEDRNTTLGKVPEEKTGKTLDNEQAKAPEKGATEAQNVEPAKFIEEERSKLSVKQPARAPEAEAATFMDLKTILPEYLDLQRRRIGEYEEKLRNFEMRLEDVRKLSTEYACKCEIHRERLLRRRSRVRDRKPSVQRRIIEKGMVVTGAEDRYSASDYPCSWLPSKIEIISKKKICTCQKCKNIHVIEKRYLPMSWLKRCKVGGWPATEEKLSMRLDKTEGERPVEKANSASKVVDTGKEDDKTEDEGFNDAFDKTHTNEKCDQSAMISCECGTKCGNSNGKEFCDCDWKLKLLESQLKALEAQIPGAGHKPAETPVSDEGTTDTSFENIESETDNEIKKKVIACNNLDFFIGGDPKRPTKCSCTEDSSCAFKVLGDHNHTAETKDVFFMTNIEVFRRWSGYCVPNYSYCKSFWNVKKSKVKPVKIHRNWGDFKSAVGTFFRPYKGKLFGGRKERADGESSAVDSTVSSDSDDSFIDDCSRSSMPLKKRSFRVLSVGPLPTRPAALKHEERRRRMKKNRWENEP